MKLLFIGDIHSKINKLLNVYEEQKGSEYDAVYQVGDFGFRPLIKSLPDNFKFIRGNRDNPDMCKKIPNYLGDWGYESKYSLFYYSGAKSNDAQERTQGVDWWKTEEIGDIKAQMALADYKVSKPNVVISHDCPSIIQYNIIKDLKLPNWGQSLTNIKLQEAFEYHRPKWWFFGHYHPNLCPKYSMNGIWREEFKGTRFVCLGELKTYGIEI